MALVYYCSHFVVLMFCKVWFRLRRTGGDRIPDEGGVVFACNHASYLDPLLVGTMTSRRVWYVARSSLGRIPLVGLWIRAVGVVFIDRKAAGREVIGRVIERLQAGETVGMFPEGTRSRDGRLHEFRPGLLLLLKKSQARVVPVGIRGSFSAFPPGGIVPKPCRCSVHFGRPWTSAEVLAPGGLEALRREVAELSGADLA